MRDIHPEPTNLSAGEVVEITGISLESLQLLRKQKYVHPIAAKKGERKVYCYPAAEVEKIRIIKRFLDEGFSAQRAVAKAEDRLRGEATIGHAPESAMPNTTRSIERVANGFELGRLLTTFCLRSGKTEAEIRLRFTAWARSQSPEKHWEAIQKRLEDLSSEPHGNNPLIAEALGQNLIPFTEARSLAQAMWDVHPLLLDFLYSRADPDGSAKVLAWDADFTHVGDPRDPGYGEGCTYSVPLVRLPDIGAAFGTVVLQPGGKSDSHWHPGTELAICLAGEIIVRLEEQGVEAIVTEGGLIHFNSELRHTFVSKSLREPAILFIVRFYQCHQDIQPSKSMTVKVPTTADKDDPCLLRDRAGLLEFVRSAESPNRSGSGRRARLDAFDQLEEVSTLTVDGLGELAAALGLAPHLLHSFTAQGLADVIGLKGLSSDLDRGSEFHQVPIGQTPDGVTYWTPRRRLVNSGVLLALARLQPRAVTGHHSRHRGFEVVIPLRGTIQARFFDPDAVKVAAHKRREFLQFDSDKPHQLQNESGEVTEVLIIRILPGRQM